MRLPALVGACLALSLAACGSSGSEQSTGGTTGTQSATEKGAPRQAHIPTLWMTKAEIAKLPPLAIPTASGPPPHHLKAIDLRKGFGPRAVPTDEVSVRYIEDTYPQALRGRQGGLSEGVVSLRYWLSQASRGIRAGVPGMRVGGRRELIVPPKIAYPRWQPRWGYAPYVSIYVVDLLGTRRD